MTFRQKVNILLRQIKNGDVAKTTELFLLTYGHIKAVAYFYVRNLYDCEDVVNEAYLRIVKYIESYNTCRDGYRWMCKVTENVARDLLRESCKYILYEDTPADVFGYFDDTDIIIDRFDLFSIVSTFTVRDKDFFYYRFYLNLTYEDIGAKYGCTRSYVHKRVKLIVEKIKKYFIYG